MASNLPSYSDAAALVRGYTAKLAERHPTCETIRLGDASGRVLAQPVVADRDQPPFTRAGCDGYACRADEANGGLTLKIAGSARAGDAPDGSLPAGAAWEIMNGAPVPAGADAVMALRHVELRRGKVKLAHSRSLKPGENIVSQGAQAREQDELIAAGSVLHPSQIALAAACGFATIDVFVRPRVAVLTTGDELVSVDSSPAPGQIRNSNAPMLAAMVADMGGEASVLPATADNAAALDAALNEAQGADLLLISGGISAGKFDLVRAALARFGACFHFTGVNIKPGKPTIFGELPRPGARPLPFLAFPGNPIATAVGFKLFAASVLAALAGNQASFPRFGLARLATPIDLRGESKMTRLLPAFCDFGAKTGTQPSVSVVPTHGSGDLTALARSNCFLIVPEETCVLKSDALIRLLLS